MLDLKTIINGAVKSGCRKPLLLAPVILAAGLMVVKDSGPVGCGQRQESMRLDAPESFFTSSGGASIRFRQAGEGDGETVYLNQPAGSGGAPYLVRCRDGVCYGIQVVCDLPLSRLRALAIMRKLLPEGVVLGEHDDVELSKSHLLIPSEFFYYHGGYWGQLIYAAPDRVTEVSVWAPQGTERQLAAALRR